MNMSDMQFSMAAMEIRAMEAHLTGQLAVLRDSQQWMGPDAERFYQQWDADIRGRLLAAATKLDTLAVVPFL